MKFSFVIPTHNKKDLLKNTLEALNFQNGYGFDDYEVIIVDDGSSDNTFEHIQGINRSYPLKYIYLERCPESCRARTRNTGWKNAAGEFIAFIDSDIIVKRDYLSELDRCFSMSKDILVIGARLMLHEPVDFHDIETGAVFEKYHFDRNNYDLLEYRYFLYEVISYNINAIPSPWTQTHSCNMAAPKIWLEKVGGFDENFKGWGMEDVELGYSLYIKNIQPIINSKLEALHQYHGERNDLVIKKEDLPGYEANIDYFLQKHPRPFGSLSKKKSHQVLKGEVADTKLLEDYGYRYIEVDFRDKSQLEQVKELILKHESKLKTVLVINDYVEDSDLDIWIQLPKEIYGKPRYNPLSKWVSLKQLLIYFSFPRYYPMSKRMNRNEMVQFLVDEKARQRMRA